jgi:hypothetical protein
VADWITDKKTSIPLQLNKIIIDLQSLPFTPGTPLGGIAGEGCTLWIAMYFTTRRK